MRERITCQLKLNEKYLKKINKKIIIKLTFKIFKLFSIQFNKVFCTETRRPISHT